MAFAVSSEMDTAFPALTGIETIGHRVDDLKGSTVLVIETTPIVSKVTFDEIETQKKRLTQRRVMRSFVPSRPLPALMTARCRSRWMSAVRAAVILTDRIGCRFIRPTERPNIKR